MLEQLSQLDKDLFLFFNSLGNEKWDGFWLFITHKFSFVPLYAILLFLVYKYYGWKDTVIILVVIVLMITSTDQLANLFKHGFKRPRPCQSSAGMGDAIRFIAKNCGRYGYFSAHAASSMATAVFLIQCLKKRYKYTSLILIPWAVLTGYSRIYLGVHYPFDVVTGAIIGVLVGLLFFKIQLLIRKRYGERKIE